MNDSLVVSISCETKIELFLDMQEFHSKPTKFKFNP